MDAIRILTAMLFVSAVIGLAYTLFVQTIHRFKGRRLSKHFHSAAPQYFKRYRATP